MAAAINMPDIKSGKLLQIDELDNWSPDERHGNAVRIMGRVKRVDFGRDVVFLEYHGRELAVHTAEIQDPRIGLDHIGTMFMCLGELERFENELLLRARIVKEMKGVDVNLYDRCLKIRKDFDKNVLDSTERKNDLLVRRLKLHSWIENLTARHG
ncbi:unnamed protein product [Agarophyton chilense]